MIRLILFLVIFVVGGSICQAQWQKQEIATDADFRGLCAVNANVAWVSGTKGRFGRTTDGGKTWIVGSVPGAEKLDFRDVEGFQDATAYLLSAGPGDASRIYKTTDGGKSWTMQFKNTDPDGFFDAIAFWDENHGLAFGDPVKGRFQLIRTDDGGATWKPLPTNILPAALPNEGAFAASGTCLVTLGDKDVWFATGGAKSARVFHSADRGLTWSVSETPVISGIASAGIFSMGWRDAKNGIVVGGDYRQPNSLGANAAITNDGGQTWTVLDKPFPFRSGVAFSKDRYIVVGTSGSHQSTDNGTTWQAIDRENYNSVAFTKAGEGWAAGPKGRIAKWGN